MDRCTCVNGLRWILAHSPDQRRSGFIGDVRGWAYFSRWATSNVVYVSTNQGAAWGPTLVDDQWTGSWDALACSVDGSRIFAASSDGIFISTDHCLHWRRVQNPDAFQCIAVSADGSRIVAVATNLTVHTSIDGGSTWSVTNLLKSWPWPVGVAMSADGTYTFASALYVTTRGLAVDNLEFSTRFVP